jgi:ElaB/YqjD/DUF883 family membrane-anchored ribosome-binding protein
VAVAAVAAVGAVSGDGRGSDAAAPVVGTQREVHGGMQPSTNKTIGNSPLASRVDAAMANGREALSNAKDVAADVKDSALDAADAARGKLGAARERIGEMASAVGDTARSAGRGTRRGVMKAGKTVAAFVEDRPWIAVGAAFVLGCAVVSLIAVRRR